MAWGSFENPILAANEIKLPTGNEPRVALACKVQLPDDREIMVVNLHFDWVKDDSFRFQQAKALAKYLDNLTLPYVLMGDFNDQPQSRTLDLLSKGTLSAVKPSQTASLFLRHDRQSKLISFLPPPESLAV